MKKIYSILSILCAAFFTASCITDADLETKNAGEGYLRVNVETNVNTVTRVQDVPSDYNPKTLHVEVLDANGNLAKNVDGVDLITDDFANASIFKGHIRVVAGTYTIVAHSAKWDGSQSAFSAPYYAGQTSVVVNAGEDTPAKITCTLATVKVTVKFGEKFKKYVANAQSVASSALSDVYSQTFILNKTTESAYFPVGDLSFVLTMNNDASNQLKSDIHDVKARDHYIINYELSGDPSGKQGDIHVYVDDETHTYTYDVIIPLRSNVADVNFVVNNAKDITADAFDGTTVTLSGDVTGNDIRKDKVVLRYKKKAESDWTTVENSQLTISDINDGATYACTLTTLEAGVPYEYQLAQVDESKSATSSSVDFIINGEDIYNGGFESWYQNSENNAWYANASGVSYWDSSNPGSASVGNNNVTTQDTSVKHGGNSSARLGSKYIVIKFAAASIYTGEFDHLVGTKGAVLNWGCPFTGRPVSLHGFFRYKPGNINRGSQPSGIGAPAKGDPDQCQIYCALTTEVITVDNTDIAGTFPDWETDSRVVAYGTLPTSECVSTNEQWKEFDIPLVYHNTTTKPTHIIIVCSSSKYGDYFYGSDSSVLHLDDFEMSYAGTPIVK